MPEERVRGHRFRVQCKQCDGIIVAHCDRESFTLRPLDGEVGTRAPSPGAIRLDGSELLHREPETGAAAHWYVGIRGRPHGPHTEQELGELLAQGEISGRSYAWCLGQPSWRRIVDLDQFHDYLLEAQLTEIYAQDEPVPSSLPVLSIEGLGRAETVDRRLLQEELSHGSLPGADTPEDVALDEPERQPLDPRAEEAALVLDHEPRARPSVTQPLAAEQDSYEVFSQVTPEPEGLSDEEIETRLHASLAAFASTPRAARAQVSSQLLPPGELEPEETSGHFSLPSIPSPEEVSLDLSVAGARLPTEIVQLIPRKLVARPPRVERARPTFAPPVPEEAIPPASPSILVRRQPQPSGRARQLVIALGAPSLLVALVVLAYVIGSDKPKQGGAERAVVAVSPAPIARAQDEVVTVEGEQDQAAAAPLAAAAPVPKTPRAPERGPSLKEGPPSRVSPEHALGRPLAGQERNSAERGRGRRTRGLAVASARPRASSRAKTSRSARAPKPRPTRQPAPDELVQVEPPVTPQKAAATSRSPAAVDEEPRVPNPDDILEVGALAARRRLSEREGQASPPGRPSKKDVARVMSALRPEVQSCFDSYQNAGVLKIRITVQPYGRAVGEVVGLLAGTPTAACVLGKLPNVQFPTFAGEPFSFTYAYTLQ